MHLCVGAYSTPNGAELTRLFVPARIRSRARQKGWGPFSNWYKSRGGCRRQPLTADTPPWGGLVGAHMCCLVLANAWVIWAGRRHERRSSAGVFYHPGPMAGAAAGMPQVVLVLHVINSDVDELDLRLGITEDGDIVFVVREAVQRARGVQKSKANEALAGNASENLARALGIAGGIFDTARWPGSVNAQDTCEVQHIAKVLDWALENYHGAKGLTVDKRVALVADVRAKLVPHAQQRISGVRGRMAVSMGLDTGQVDQDLAVLCAENERAKVATTQLQQAHAELSSVREEASRGSTALAAAHSELAEEVRLRTQLQQRLIDLKAELKVAQEELAHMHAPGPLLLVEEDASMNETRDQVI